VSRHAASERQSASSQAWVRFHINDILNPLDCNFSRNYAGSENTPGVEILLKSLRDYKGRFDFF
jgi:hypothetical protein